MLAEFAADKAQQPARRRHRQLAGAGTRIVDELVDRQIGVGADRHRGLIKEEKLRLPDIGHGDALVKHHLLAYYQRPRAAPRRCAGGLLIDGAADADALLSQSGPAAKQQRDRTHWKERKRCKLRHRAPSRSGFAGPPIRCCWYRRKATGWMKRCRVVAARSGRGCLGSESFASRRSASACHAG